jgi:hypothetical protein
MRDWSRLRAALMRPSSRFARSRRTFAGGSTIMAYLALGKVLEADQKSGDIDGCVADRAALLALIPPDRLELSASDREKLIPECRAAR